MDFSFKLYDDSLKQVYSSFLKKVSNLNRITGVFHSNIFRELEDNSNNHILIFYKNELVSELYFMVQDNKFKILYFLFSDKFLVDNFDENSRSNIYQILNYLDDEDKIKNLQNNVITFLIKHLVNNFNFKIEENNLREEFENYFKTLNFLKRKEELLKDTHRLEKILEYLEIRLEKANKEDNKEFKKNYKFLIKIIKKLIKSCENIEKFSNTTRKNILKIFSFFKDDKKIITSSINFLLSSYEIIGKDTIKVLEFLDGRFQKENTNKIVITFPGILSCSLDRTQEILRFLDDRFQKENTNKIVITFPNVLGCSLDRTQEILRFLDDRFQKENTNKIVITLPNVLSCSLDRTQKILRFLDDRFQKENTNKIVITLPNVLGYSL